MTKWQIIPILIVSAAACITAVATQTSMEGVLLYSGWALVVATVLSLGLYRLMLSLIDHRAQAAGMPASNRAHQWFHHREVVVDRVGVPLTLGALLLTVAVVVFTLSQLLDAAVHRAVTLFTLHQ